MCDTAGPCRRYVIIGPPNTPYEGGVYQGKLKFPSEFPFKPPSIYMITPNGTAALARGTRLQVMALTQPTRTLRVHGGATQAGLKPTHGCACL